MPRIRAKKAGCVKRRFSENICCLSSGHFVPDIVGMAEAKFQQELAAFEQRKEELLKLCPGKFAVFRGNDFLGVFDSPLAGFDAGIAKWGNVEFLIKQVVPVERPDQFPALFAGLLHAHP
jgi:hypothetical protein